MKKTILTTLNARYAHTSIGLRYLFANLKEFQDEALILEYVIDENPQSIAEEILEYLPEIIGIGVYIWNVKNIEELVCIIKKVSPEIKIVLGGPEVSHLPMRVNFDLADYIVQGEGEIAFYQLCKDIYNNTPPKNRIVGSKIVDIKKIELPYRFYSDHDIQNRRIYVEVSRGCPFLCEFCLSSIDKKVRNFDIDILLDEFEILWQRGVRNFKFIDRTINLNIKIANQLLDFFLKKNESYFVHFEVIPDHFPDELKKRISKFPPKALQLEIGIQTLNQKVALNISRNLNLKKIKENIVFLQTKTHAHLHLDLIVGLPQESLESFAKNLNELCSITDSEIQIGILKNLSGTTLFRHDKEFGMVYSDKPPYDILKNDCLTFAQIQQMKRFSRYWDLLYNSGNFKKTVSFLWEDGDVFNGFFAFSNWLYMQTKATWKIALNRLAKLLFEYLVVVLKKDKNIISSAMSQDMTKVKGRDIPPFLKEFITDPKISNKNQIFNKRQQKH